LRFVDVEAAMALAPVGPGVRSLVIRGKAAAADGVAVLTLAARAADGAPSAAVSPASRTGVRMRYHAVITGLTGAVYTVGFSQELTV
jgi:hypothetical protein